MKTGIELIAEERQRQISQEGWTTEHDDEHSEDELARAAACYSIPHWERELQFRATASESRFTYVDRIWPWDAKWWKPTPKDRIRELVKAGALIVAEIDRLQRKEKP